MSWAQPAGHPFAHQLRSPVLVVEADAEDLVDVGEGAGQHHLVPGYDIRAAIHLRKAHLQ